MPPDLRSRGHKNYMKIQVPLCEQGGIVSRKLHPHPGKEIWPPSHGLLSLCNQMKKRIIQCLFIERGYQHTKVINVNTSTSLKLVIVGTKLKLATLLTFSISTKGSRARSLTRAAVS